VELSGLRDDNYSLKSLGGQKIEVEARTIDSILKQLNVAEVDWVKIDVEGAEVEVLEGMRELIKRSPRLKILIEVREENRKRVDEILRGFKKKILGGDDPNVPVIFYWRG